MVPYMIRTPHTRCKIFVRDQRIRLIKNDLGHFENLLKVSKLESERKSRDLF